MYKVGEEIDVEAIRHRQEVRQMMIPLVLNVITLGFLVYIINL